MTQWFDPEPTAKGALFAQKLAELGNDVTVVTGFPNYPGGKLYPGFRMRLWQRSKDGCVQIVRVPLYPSHDNRVSRRILNYCSFALTSTIAVLTLPRADVAYVYHPPGSMGLPAVILRFLRDTPFVYDVQDLWPESLNATGMVNSRFVVRSIEWWMSVVYKSAALVIVLSPGLAKTLESKQVAREKIRVIYNWTFENIPVEVENASTSLKGFDPTAFNVVYAGNIGPAQQLDLILDAAEKLSRRSNGFQFHIIGTGMDLARLKEMTLARGITNIAFHGQRPPGDMPSILSNADALLVHLRDDPLFRITIPSKTQAYLRAGRPIIIGVSGDAADLVSAAAAGFPFDPGDGQQLASTIVRIAGLPEHQREAMGHNGQGFYRQNLAADVGVPKFVEAFHEAVKRQQPRQRIRWRRILFAVTAVPLVAGLRESRSHHKSETTDGTSDIPITRWY